MFTRYSEVLKEWARDDQRERGGLPRIGFMSCHWTHAVNTQVQYVDAALFLEKKEIGGSIREEVRSRDVDHIQEKKAKIVALDEKNNNEKPYTYSG